MRAGNNRYHVADIEEMTMLKASYEQVKSWLTQFKEEMDLGEMEEGEEILDFNED